MLAAPFLSDRGISGFKYAWHIGQVALIVWVWDARVFQILQATHIGARYECLSVRIYLDQHIRQRLTRATGLRTLEDFPNIPSEVGGKVK